MLETIGELRALYSKLLNDVSTYEKDICTFFVQTGKEYFSSSKRLLFIGKATNGWISEERDVEKLFDLENPYRIVNRRDQMEWVHQLEGARDTYNTKKSAFWRLIKNVSFDFLCKEDWYNYVAWSNLFKIAPWEGGNPNSILRQLQSDTCVSILHEELRLLKPDAIILLTSGWEALYFDSLGLSESNRNVQKWNHYSSFYQIHNGILFIQSVHPQGKPEQEHADCLVTILTSNFGTVGGR